MGIRQSSDGRGHVHQSPPNRHRVKGAWWNLKRACRIRRAEVEVRNSTLKCLFTRDLQHPVVQFKTDNETIWSYSSGSAERRLAWSGCHVEHAHAWANSREVEHPFAERRGQTRFDAVVPPPKL